MKGKWVKLYRRRVGKREQMTGLAACLYNQLLKYANNGRVRFCVKGLDTTNAVGWLTTAIAYTYGASISDRRLLPELLTELIELGAIVVEGPGCVALPEHEGHRPGKHKLVLDGEDYGWELFRKWYCTEAGTFACLSLLARGLTGDVVCLCENDGRITYTGDMVGWFARRLNIRGPRRRILRRLLAELEADGIFRQETDGIHTWLHLPGFGSHQAPFANVPDGTVIYSEGETRKVPAAPAPAPKAPTPPVPARRPEVVASAQSGELFPSSPSRRAPRRSDWARPPWWLRITAGYPLPKDARPGARHPNEKKAYQVAQLAQRDLGIDGDAFADLVLTAVGWQRGLTKWLRGYHPHLVNYLGDEKWTEQRPGAEAFLAPDVKPWERERALEVQRQRERDAAAERATAERLRQMEAAAVLSRYDWTVKETWSNPYLQGLSPADQKLHDDQVRRQIGEMRAQGLKRSSPLPLWVTQFLAAHERPARLPTVSDDAPAVPAEFRQEDGQPMSYTQIISSLAATTSPPPTRFAGGRMGRGVAYDARGSQATGKKAAS